MKFFETNRTPREETKSNKDTSTRVWADLINVVNKQIFWYFSTVATPRDINFVVTQKKKQKWFCTKGLAIWDTSGFEGRLEFVQCSCVKNYINDKLFLLL